MRFFGRINNLNLQQGREFLELRPDGVERIEKIDCITIHGWEGLDYRLQLRYKLIYLLIDWTGDLGVLQNAQVKAQLGSNFSASVKT